MEKDKLVEQMLSEMGNKNNKIDLDAYARGLIDMYDRLIENLDYQNCDEVNFKPQPVNSYKMKVKIKSVKKGKPTIHLDNCL